MFLTDINEAAGVETRQELSKEYGVCSVGFHVHDVTSADSWTEVWDAAETFFPDQGVQVSCGDQHGDTSQCLSGAGQQCWSGGRLGLEGVGRVGQWCGQGN